MRVGILEWVCGGGLLETPLEEIPASWKKEGWTMLTTLARDLVRAGHCVSLGLDARFEAELPMTLSAPAVEVQPLHSEATLDLTAAWVNVAKQCEWTIVIAPECDHTLLEICEALRAGGGRLLNASAEFTSLASDKIATARVLQNVGLPCPATRRLNAVDAAWLDRVAPQATVRDGRSQWVVKPSDGAGAENLRRLGRDELESMIAAERASQRKAVNSMIVQPWLAGQPLSCSAILSGDGRAHWLPLVSQEFSVGSASPAGQRLHYLGCRLPPSSPRAEHQAQAELKPPTDLLDRLIAAMGPPGLGWIGVDLVYDAEHTQWSIIEVNPRCTTSLAGLSQCYSENLSAELVRAGEENFAGLAGKFRAGEFWL